MPKTQSILNVSSDEVVAYLSVMHSVLAVLVTESRSRDNIIITLEAITSLDANGDKRHMAANHLLKSIKEVIGTQT